MTLPEVIDTALIACIIIGFFMWVNSSPKRTEPKQILYVPTGDFDQQTAHITKSILTARTAYDLIKIYQGITHISKFFHDEPEVYQTVMDLYKAAWDKEMELFLATISNSQTV